MKELKRSRDELRPGDLAAVSGVYEAVHADHRPPHLVVILVGDEIPPCRRCEHRVRLYLRHTVPHATADWDFAGPLGMAAEAP